MKKYCVHYHDERLTLKYQAKEIETNDIQEWIDNFSKENHPYVIVLEFEPLF
jgi:hypothetical protein